jgi:hypothetical protein
VDLPPCCPRYLFRCVKPPIQIVKPQCSQTFLIPILFALPFSSNPQCRLTNSQWHTCLVPGGKSDNSPPAVKFLLKLIIYYILDQCHIWPPSVCDQSSLNQFQPQAVSLHHTCWSTHIFWHIAILPHSWKQIKINSIPLFLPFWLKHITKLFSSMIQIEGCDQI